MAVWKDSGGRWNVEVRDNGRRIHRRCPEGATAQEARQLEASFRRDQWLGRLGRKPEPLISEALQLHLDDLKAKLSYARSASHAFRLHESIQRRRISEAPEAAAAFVEWARAREYKPATINRSLAALKRAASLAFKRGLIEADVSRRIELLPERNARTVYLTVEQVAALCTRAPEIAGPIRIAAYTGLRLGELLALTAADVTGTAIIVRTSKTGHARTIPAVAALADDLRGIPITGSRRWLQKRFRLAADAIGMAHVHWHDLRHTTASLLANAGVPLYVIGQILGHRAQQTTARYSHLVDGTKRAALELISTRITPAETDDGEGERAA